jgi:hypothetical protein
MEKPKVLYHGSSKKLIGEKLVPKKPTDLENKKENLYEGIYATDIKDLAITMAIICSKGVISSGLNFQKNNPEGIIYNGWPEQEKVFIYTLPSKSFKQTGKIKHQFVSKTPVKPLKLERVSIKDYPDLFRKATKKEKEEWIKKYGEL